MFFPVPDCRGVEILLCRISILRWIFISGGGSSCTEMCRRFKGLAQAERRSAEEWWQRPFILCGHIPGPISSNNTENSRPLGWIFYDCAIQTNGLHWLEMSVMFVQRWHAQITRHLAVVQGNYLLTIGFSLRCFSSYF